MRPYTPAPISLERPEQKVISPQSKMIGVQVNLDEERARPKIDQKVWEKRFQPFAHEPADHQFYMEGEPGERDFYHAIGATYLAMHLGADSHTPGGLANFESRESERAYKLHRDFLHSTRAKLEQQSVNRFEYKNPVHPQWLNDTARTISVSKEGQRVGADMAFAMGAIDRQEWQQLRANPSHLSQVAEQVNQYSTSKGGNTRYRLGTEGIGLYIDVEAQTVRAITVEPFERGRNESGNWGTVEVGSDGKVYHRVTDNPVHNQYPKKKFATMYRLAHGEGGERMASRAVAERIAEGTDVERVRVGHVELRYLATVHKSALDLRDDGSVKVDVETPTAFEYLLPQIEEMMEDEQMGSRFMWRPMVAKELAKKLQDQPDVQFRGRTKRDVINALDQLLFGVGVTRQLRDMDQETVLSKALNSGEEEVKINVGQYSSPNNNAVLPAGYTIKMVQENNGTWRADIRVTSFGRQPNLHHMDRVTSLYALGMLQLMSDNDHPILDPFKRYVGME